MNNGGPFRLKLRIIEKATRRTYVAYYPWFAGGIALCMATGWYGLINNRNGYAEYNDRGEPVLDSYTKAERFVICGLHSD